MVKVTFLDYGAGNIRSLRNALIKVTPPLPLLSRWPRGVHCTARTAPHARTHARTHAPTAQAVSGMGAGAWCACGVAGAPWARCAVRPGALRPLRARRRRRVS